MARIFVNASSEWLGALTGIDAGLRDEPLTVATTHGVSSSGITASAMISIYGGGAFQWFEVRQYKVGSTFFWEAETSPGFASKRVAQVTAVAPLSATWHRVVAIFGSATNRSIHVSNGVGSATNTQTANTSGNSSLSIAARTGSTRYYNASMGETAFWDAAFSTDEIQAWFSGVPAEGIQPSNLIYRFPIRGLQSPEPNVIGPEQLTVNGTPLMDVSDPFANVYSGG